MFQLRVYGRFGGVEGPEMWIETAHHETGYERPVLVQAVLPDRLVVRAERMGLGALVWCEGDGYQYRTDEDELRLGVRVTALTAFEASLEGGREQVFAVVHGWLAGDPVAGVGRGRRQGHEVVNLDVHAHSPHMDDHVVLRCKSWLTGGPDLLTHRAGDRINIEGNLRESRWLSDGVERCAHEVTLTRWTWARDHESLVLANRVTSRRITDEPEVIKR